MKEPGNRVELMDAITARLNHYQQTKAPHMSRPAIVTEALIEYMDKRERTKEEAVSA